MTGVEREKDGQLRLLFAKQLQLQIQFRKEKQK